MNRQSSNRAIHDAGPGEDRRILSAPPRIAFAMLSSVLPLELRDDVLGDLQEGFLSRLSDNGNATARRWYWRQALRSLRYARGGANASDPLPGRRTPKLQRAFMGFFKYDLSYAIRQLRGNPGFTAVAVLSLALGIGVNSTIFTVVNGFLLKPLPVADIDEVIEIFTSTPDDPFNMSSYLDYVDYRDAAEAFDGLAAEMTMVYSWNRETHSEMLFGSLVSGNYFDVLGIDPDVGRWFIPEENRTPRTHPVAVLAHGFWERNFAGDPSVIGDTLKFNGTHFTIVGVAPPEFTGTIPIVQPDLWTPLMTEPIINPFDADSTFIEERGRRSLRIYGRLADGSTIELQNIGFSTLSELSIDTLAGALNALDVIKLEQENIRYQQGVAGSEISRFRTQAEVLERKTSVEARAMSRIVDADFADETTRLAKNLLMSDTSSALLVQARVNAAQVYQSLL